MKLYLHCWIFHYITYKGQNHCRAYKISRNNYRRTWNCHRDRCFQNSPLCFSFKRVHYQSTTHVSNICPARVNVCDLFTGRSIASYSWIRSLTRKGRNALSVQADVICLVRTVYRRHNFRINLDTLLVVF